MPKLPLIYSDKAIKSLEKLGFQKIRQKGSHIVLKKKTSSGDLITVIPNYKQLARGTLKGILKLAKVTLDDFLDNL